VSFRPARTVLTASTRFRTHAINAVASSKSTFAGNLDQLRESAIEPLPQLERMPQPLRELEWRGKSDGAADPAGIVRKLRSRTSGPEEQNELGCAYALLAWERSLDAYWLDAIDELQDAAAGSDAEVARRARANLERVIRVSSFPL
jgi:hypothetical protein